MVGDRTFLPEAVESSGSNAARPSPERDGPSQRSAIRRVIGIFGVATLALAVICLVTYRRARRTPHEGHRAASTLLESRHAARALIAQFDVTAGEAALRSHLAAFPDDHAAAEELFWLYFSLFRVRDAAALLDERRTSFPDRYDLLMHRVVSEFRGPVARESLPYLQRMEEQRPGQPQVLRALAYCHWQIGELEIARESFERALASAPQDVETLLAVGEFLLDQRQLKLVSEIVQRLDSLETGTGGDDRSWWIRSRLAEEEGRTADALRLLESSLQLRPFELKYQQRRAMLLQRLGRSVEASAAYRRAEELSACQMRLTEIAWAGALQNPDTAVSLEVAELCRVRGLPEQAVAWELWARRLSGDIHP